MYTTVFNKYTGKLVPFFIEEDGEIRIMSSDPRDTDESCVVKFTEIFYETSHDYKVKEKMNG